MQPIHKKWKTYFPNYYFQYSLPNSIFVFLIKQNTMTKTMCLPESVNMERKLAKRTKRRNKKPKVIIKILNHIICLDFLQITTSSCSSVNNSFWTFHVSAWVRLNSATALVTVDLTGDGSPLKRASSVTCSGNQLKESS